MAPVRMGFGIRQSWIWVPALSLAVGPWASHNLSEPQLPLPNRGLVHIHQRLVGRLN